jgi:hypothetical protein
MRLLDLFCGRFGWSRAFAARGWECIGIDLIEPPEIPANCHFIKGNVLDFWSTPGWIHQNNKFACFWSAKFDFVVASSPCEDFSVYGMKHFHPNPPFPYCGIKMFNHAREICENYRLPYVMENVRSAQQFVGRAMCHCGPFYLWGNATPPILPKGITKGTTRQMGFDGTGKRIIEGPRKYASGSKGRAEEVAKRATIPPELANCVADYAERLLEQKAKATVSNTISTTHSGA